ncbi:MAG: hypothetical protein JWN55_2743 [Frankiales bacterium]|nr:hypothetical protein [Frankiales bacterium]
MAGRAVQAGAAGADKTIMASTLGLVSAGCVLGAVAVVGHWSTRRRDAIGRPRAFPVWSITLLAVLALAAAVPGAQRRAHEHRLARVAGNLVGHQVTVHCQTTTGAMVDSGAELGYVRFDADGDPEPATTLKRDPCRDLKHYVKGGKAQPSLNEVVAVHVLTHEAMHLRGETNEAWAECEAVQRDALTASLLGASPEQAMALAQRYWTAVYPLMPDEYRTTECGPGARLDERLTSAPWAAG